MQQLNLCTASYISEHLQQNTPKGDLALLLALLQNMTQYIFLPLFNGQLEPLLKVNNE